MADRVLSGYAGVPSREGGNVSPCSHQIMQKPETVTLRYVTFTQRKEAEITQDCEITLYSKMKQRTKRD